MSEQLLTCKQFDMLEKLRRRRWARNEQKPDAYTKRSIQQMRTVERNKRNSQDRKEYADVDGNMGDNTIGGGHSFGGGNTNMGNLV